MENVTLAPGDYLAVLKRRKWNILIPIISILLISVIVAFALPPIYKSTTTILIEQQDVPLEYVKSSVSTYAEQQMQIINQRIMSSTRLLDIINRLNLYPELKDTMMTEEIIEQMRRDIALEPISVNVVDPKNRQAYCRNDRLYHFIPGEERSRQGPSGCQRTGLSFSGREFTGS